MPRVTITTPATTANFGPGFDCVGIALELFNTVSASWTATSKYSGSEADLQACLARETTVSFSGRYATDLQEIGLELFYRALARLLAKAGLKPEGLMLQLKVEIPLARGLGSSAACIVSALCLAREIAASAQQKISFTDIVEEAVKIEGHPDNVLPALYGGACINIVQAGQAPITLQFQVPEELSFVIGIPDIKLSTEAARKVLPATVSLAEAITNSANLGGLLLALQNKDFSLLAKLIHSPLHVPYRAELIPGYHAVEQAAYQAGSCAFTISGAGPSVLALTLYAPETIGEEIVRAFNDYAQLNAEYIVSKVETNGTKVERREEAS